MARDRRSGQTVAEALCSALAASPADRAVGLAPGGEPWLQARLLEQPLEAATWQQLGRLWWDRAVAEQSEPLRRQAQSCLDLARLLSWPWPEGPPSAAWERMQLTRYGRTTSAAWPDDSETDQVRASALAWLAEPAGGESWANAFRANSDRLRQQAPALWFWLTCAVTEAQGDAEEGLRQMEQAAGWDPGSLVPDWLADLGQHACRAAGAAGYTRLREAARQQRGVTGALAEPLVLEVLSRLTAAEVPLTAARLALESPGGARGDAATAVRLGRLAALGEQHRSVGGEAILELVRSQAEGLGEAARRVVGIATAPPAEAAVNLGALLDELPTKRRQSWLCAAAGLLPRLAPADRAELSARLLNLAEQARGREATGRLPLTCAVLRALGELPPDLLRPLVEQAARGWTSSDEHDRAVLAGVETLLAAGRGELFELARFHSTRVERQALRSLAMLRLAAACELENRVESRRLADGAVRRMRSWAGQDARSWPLQLEAARRLAKVGEPEGLALLRDAVRRLGQRWTNRRHAYHLAACVRALCEAGREHPDAAETARQTAALVPRHPARWLAELYLADLAWSREPELAATHLQTAVAMPARWQALPGGAALEASLLRHLTAAGSPLWRPVLALANPTPQIPDLTSLDSRAGRLVGLTAKLHNADELAALVSWATSAPAGWAVIGLGLAADGLELLVRRRGAMTSERAGQALREAWQTQLGVARRLRT